MDIFKFKAIGTEWCIFIDGSKFDFKLKEKILSRIQKFEKQFSRFISDSEVNSFRDSESGVYPVSKEFLLLLKRADLLREYTNGLYNPAVGDLLEKAGYDQKYSFKTKNDIEEFSISEWSIESDSIKLGGSIVFDLGGIGKGYAIDMVAETLKEAGKKYYMVEAGGDMFGTSKVDGVPWNVAIQYPGKPDDAVGEVILLSEAIAVSDIFKRRWGRWNHIVHPYLKTSIKNIIGAVAIASNAFDADCMTSVLFFGNENSYKKAAKEFNTAYLVFYANGSCLVSGNWRGELFK